MRDPLDLLMARYPMLGPCRKSIEEAYALLHDCYAAGGKLLVCGNGGSAADAEHIVGELMKGFTLPRPLPALLQSELAERFGPEGVRMAAGLECALPAISLVSHNSLISAIANDGAPDLVFAQQVLGYGNVGDALLAISTSGNAGNVCHALQIARLKGVATIGLTGQGGGKMAALCDVAICCPSSNTAEIQELHLPIYHTLCILLETQFFGEPG